MYISRTLYERYAVYSDKSSPEFFVMASESAFRDFKKGKKIKKKDAKIVYGTSVKGFDPKKDKSISRIEMNQRGVLRDFIGIDWDFNKGEGEKLKTLLHALVDFHDKYNTPVIIYPTFSFPEKPRVRTVMFTRDLMDAEYYAKAVTFVIDKLGVDPGDEGNFNVSHNFNLPIINTDAQRKMMKKYENQDSEPLMNELWAKTRSKKKIMKQKAMKRHPVDDRLEVKPRDKERIDMGLENLSEQIQKKEIRTFDFSNWGYFFQFLHSVARAECVGAISHDDALYILTIIAGGNIEWERKNIEDYKRELPRVRDNEEKLEVARPLQYYFGDRW